MTTVTLGRYSLVVQRSPPFAVQGTIGKGCNNTGLSLANEGADPTSILNHVSDRESEVTMNYNASQQFGSPFYRLAPFAETQEGTVTHNSILPGRSAPGTMFSRGFPGAPDLEVQADISECESEFVVRVELVGIRRDQLHVILDGNILSIAGRTEQQRNGDINHAFKRSDRDDGAFHRRFTVPESTMRDKVTADCRNGILTVHLPKDPVGPMRPVEIDFEPLEVRTRPGNGG
jgi:HSP20 family protein